MILSDDFGPDWDMSTDEEFRPFLDALKAPFGPPIPTEEYWAEMKFDGRVKVSSHILPI